MEIEAIVNVLYFCWVNFFLQVSEIFFIEFGGILSGKCVFNRMLETLFVLTIDGLACGLGETFTVKILTSDLWNVASIPGDMLGFDILRGTTNPVSTLN
jgi:hypothetical protein